MSTGLIFDGIAGSSAVDSTGEILNISGADCSDWEKGTMCFNWEHSDSTQSADTLVGKVIYLKKIYSEKDCENDRQKMYWHKIEMPLIYVVGRLWDGSGHAGAQAIAAIMRDCEANKEQQLCRLSVEGSTLLKEGNVLKESVIRKIAITIKPANKTANTNVLEDPNAPEGYDRKPVKEKVKDLLEFEDASKADSEFQIYAKLSGSNEFGILSEESLAKASIGGMSGAAPSTLTGGAALQREEFIKKPTSFAKLMDLMEKYESPEFDKSEFKAFAKNNLPTASDEFLDHFASIAEDYHVVKGKKIKKHITSFSLDALDLQLRKAVEEKTEKPTPPIDTPEVYKMHVAMDGKHRQTGRFMIANNQLHHLENYHGIMENMLPEGNFDGKTIDTINKLRNSPYVSIERDSIPLTPKTTAPNHVPLLPTTKIPAHRPSVFAYHRVGMDRNHVLEVTDGNHFLDGNKLSFEEMATVMQNIKNGAAKLRYPKSKYANQIQKMEQVLEDLTKAEDLNPEDALAHISAAVKAGHVHPNVEVALRRHVFEDPMVPGIGNKYSYEQHRAKNKPGVWVSMDGNDFRNVNSMPGGHDTGDEAIRSMGTALKNAAAKVPGGKLSRNGGDEFSYFAPSHEHAIQFIHHANEHLNNVPPVQGTHKLSMSFGLGNDFQSADKALYHAKEQKVHPVTGLRMYPVGQTPNLAHSLIPGYSGPIPSRNLGQEAIHTHVPALAISQQPKLTV